jgi:hypothetical protein
MWRKTALSVKDTLEASPRKLTDCRAKQEHIRKIAVIPRSTVLPEFRANQLENHLYGRTQ